MLLFGADQPPKSATHRAYLELRRKIITGQIAPSERLKVEDLKAQLNTGAAPVREALSLLTSDQLVERLDQRGFRAAPAGRDHFQEILNLRCTLEDLALRDSLRLAGQDWEEALVIAHHHLSKVDRSDTDLFEERHRVFHMQLLAGCGSAILLKFCAQLYDLNIRYRYLAIRSKTYARRDVAAEHKAILEAAVARDADTASARLMDHYRKTGAFLSEQLA
ncbi:GntR family transcriptional regulator [Pelagibius sp.]|uniref:GntR family transcriptional regulator n=1 Tax=Pelagibius sp. TaxID=1931238 RepID=UPI0026187C52|nr:FCD domain-containing protein [Pelagibius sp.]